MIFSETYNYYMAEIADPKTQNWLFVRSPIPLGICTITYLYIILRWGPRFMKNKEPYSCTEFMKFYNICQVLTNFLIVLGIINAGWLTDHPNNLEVARCIHWLFLIKIIDLSETVIFVLRKKRSQISFLHLYHHTSTPWYAWLLIKYSPCGKFVFIAIVNSGIHVIMYMYYFLTNYGTSLQRILRPVKPLITIIQMVQFVAVAVHLLQSLTPSCKESRFLILLYITNSLINFALFFNFYRKSYKKQKGE